MILADIVLAIAALAGLGIFVGIIMQFVPEPSLIGVISVSLAMVAFDFVREIWQSIRNRRK